MIITKEYIEKVKPVNDEISDKYSWNFYRYLKKCKNKDIRVFAEKENYYHFNTLFITTPANQGNYLHYIMNPTQSPFRSYEIDTSRFKVDITDYFFNRYLEIGRCLVLPIVHKYSNRKIDDKGRVYKECEYCGKKEFLKHKIVEVWE